MTLANDKKNLSAFKVIEKEDLKGHLYFYTREGWSEEIPEDQSKLRLAFDDTCAVLRARFKDKDVFKEEFGRLLNLAHAAFSSEYAQVKAANESLEGYKNELIQKEGASIKNQYLKELASASLIASFLLIIFSIAARFLYTIAQSHGFATVDNSNGVAVQSMFSAVRWDPKYSIIHLSLLLVACMWGIWTSFAVRNIKLEFTQLQHIESDMMKPWARLLTYGLLALIIALFFQMGVLVISIGGLSTSQISDNALVAIFVGLCLGFTDKALPNEVKRRIEEFFQSARKGDA